MNLISRESLTVKSCTGVTRSFQRQAGKRTSLHDARSFTNMKLQPLAMIVPTVAATQTRLMKQL